MQRHQNQSSIRHGVPAVGRHPVSRRRQDGRFIHSIPAPAGLGPSAGESPGGSEHRVLSMRYRDSGLDRRTDLVYAATPHSALRTPHSAPAFRLGGARHDAAAAFLPPPVAPAAGHRGRLPVTTTQSVFTNTASQTFGIDGRAPAARPRRAHVAGIRFSEPANGLYRVTDEKLEMFVTFDRAVTVKAQGVYGSSAGGLVPGNTVLLTSAAHGRSTVPGAASGRSCKPVRVACLNGTADVENTFECERGK